MFRYHPKVMPEIVIKASRKRRQYEFFMSANEHIEELLSGFLDGELTAGELRELELAMSADVTLGLKLEQLRQLGSDLRSIPKRKLGEDFANRVVAAARQQALSGGAAGVEYVSRVPAIQVDARRGNRLAVGLLAALAASLLFSVFVSNWFPEAIVKTKTEELAVDPPVSPEANSAELSPEIERESDSTFVRNAPKKQVFGILPIFEIDTSLRAWDANEVGKILLNEGIVWTNPVVASDEVINVLNETRSINHALPSQGEEQVALVMVRSSGRSIDKAMLQIYQRSNDFPHVFMDLAFAMPGKELFEKVVVNPAVATPITRTVPAESADERDLESIGQFSRAATAKRSGPSLQLDAAGMSDEDEISYVLLVIRKPTE